MFDISFSELAIIGIVALIVIGPQRLPKVARTVGVLLGRAQRYVNNVKQDLAREMELEELRNFKKDVVDAADSMRSSLEETESQLNKTTGELHDSLKETVSQVTETVESIKQSAEEVDRNIEHAEAAQEQATQSQATAHAGTDALASEPATALPTGPIGPIDEPTPAHAAPSEWSPGSITSPPVRSPAPAATSAPAAPSTPTPPMSSTPGSNP